MLKSSAFGLPPDAVMDPITRKESNSFDAKCHYIHIRGKNPYLHWHDNIEIAYPLDAPCRFLVDGVTYHAEPGDMIVTGPRVTHQFLPTDESRDFVVLQISPQNLQNIHISPYLSKVFITRREIAANPELCRRIDTLFEWLIADPGSTTDNPDPAQQTLCLYLYCLLAQNFPSTDPTYSNSTEKQEFQTVFRYVNDHFRENITVSAIAQSMHMSRTKISALFLKYTAANLSDYIRNLRMDNARHLLSQGSTVTQAALESGFQSVRTFNSNFRELMGMSPSEYLLSLKNGSAE